MEQLLCSLVHDFTSSQPFSTGGEGEENLGEI
jgi:hypothetical protein